MTIENTPTINEKHINDMRNAIEHRATWFYLVIEEVQKKGIEWEELGRKAIFQCGCFHGDNRFEKTENLKQFAKQFANELYKKIFEMEIVESTDETFVVKFHYCPLVAGWLKQTNDVKYIEKLCDIAMEGDRGIVSTFENFKMELHETIASGGNFCRIEIKKIKKE